MDKHKLSARQEAILTYLKQEILSRGFPPTVREIGQKVGLKSTSTVHAHLEALEKYGYIRRDPTHPRAIEILDSDFRQQRFSLPSEEDFEPAAEIAQVPVIGNVAAGQPLLAVEQIQDYFPVAVNMLPNTQTFFLKVKGESMVNAGILNGDFVLVEQKDTAANGEIVVALVEDSATVKTFYREKDHIRLQPENDYMDPIIVHGECSILGKVIGVFRFMR